MPAPEQVELHQNEAQVMQRDDLQQRHRGGGGNVEEQGLDSARLGSVRTFAGGRRVAAQHAARVGQDDGPGVQDGEGQQQQ